MLLSKALVALLVALPLLYVSAQQNIEIGEGGGRRGIPRVVTKNKNSITQIQNAPEKEDNAELNELARIQEEQTKHSKEEDLKRIQQLVNDKRTADVMSKIREKQGHLFTHILTRTEEEEVKASKEEEVKGDLQIKVTTKEDKQKYELKSKNVEGIEELNKERVNAEKFKLNGIRELAEKQAREGDEKGISEAVIKEETKKRRTSIEQEAKKADAALKQDIAEKREILLGREREALQAVESASKSLEFKQSEARKKIEEANAVTDEQIKKKAQESHEKDSAEQAQKEQQLKEQQQKEQGRKEVIQKEQQQKEQKVKETQQKEQHQKEQLQKEEHQKEQGQKEQHQKEQNQKEQVQKEEHHKDSVRREQIQKEEQKKEEKQKEEQHKEQRQKEDVAKEERQKEQQQKEQQQKDNRNAETHAKEQSRKEQHQKEEVQKEQHKKEQAQKEQNQKEQHQKEEGQKEQHQKEEIVKEQHKKEQDQKEQVEKEQHKKEQAQKATAEGKWCECMNSNQNWQRGWSYNNCPDGHLFAGWYRDNVQNLRGIRQYKCCKPCRDNGAVMTISGCMQANWWSSFDRQGWSTCPDNYYLQGFLKNNCDWIYCLEEARCCRIDGSKGRKNCKPKDSWWGSFDREGWSVLDDNQFAYGLYRTGDQNLYNIESPFQCTFYSY